MFTRRNNDKKKSHIFCAEYDDGYARIICAFRSKAAGTRVMTMLHDALYFEELINGNVLSKRVYYFETEQGEYKENFPVFRFEKVRNRKKLDKQINETIGKLFHEHSRKYLDLHKVFDEPIRNAILGRISEPEPDQQEQPGAEQMTVE